MNKAQLVEAIALETNQPKVEIRKTIDAMIRVVNHTLGEGERITLSGLGSFSVHHTAERMGRNPRTGAPVRIPPHKSVKFNSLIDLE
ncbi:MAG: HU family DNA-binding protein [Alistipes sp.]|nr:HU family DNA-binding protein [Alistipes sp.]